MSPIRLPCYHVVTQHVIHGKTLKGVMIQCSPKYAIECRPNDRVQMADCFKMLSSALNIYTQYFL